MSAPESVRFVRHATAPIPALAPIAAAWDRALDDAVVSVPSQPSLRASLHAPGALVVTTGQQPGLFTGPLYTVHKALAAAALARRLEATWQRRVVPLFWLAGDDHDYREASHAAWIDQSGRPDRWQLPLRDDAAIQHPMAREPLPASTAEALQHLADTLPPGPHHDTTLTWLHRHYQQGATMHSAFAGALAELLAPYGVCCLDATHVAVKRAQQPLLRQALVAARELDATLAALSDPGTGIAAGNDATLVFLETSAGRDRLLIDGESFRARRSGEVWSREELLALLEAEPTRFSANVLLRPVVERAIVPTVAYVAGPGEFRYLTRQAAALYPAFGLTPQTPVPRWSGTLVEPWMERLLARLGVTAEQVIADDGTLAREIVRRDLPKEVTEALVDLRRHLDTADAVLRESGRALDPVLDRAVAGRTRSMTLIADDLEHLFERHLRKRDDIAHAQWRRVADALRPGGAPQERHLTAATFLGRYGTAWMDSVVGATNAWAEEWNG